MQLNLAKLTPHKTNPDKTNPNKTNPVRQSQHPDQTIPKGWISELVDYSQYISCVI